MADVAPPAFKKRTKASHIRKRPATPPPEDSDSGSGSGSGSDSDYTSAEEEGVRVKRRKKEGVTVTAAVQKHTTSVEKHSTAFEADRTTTLASNEDATKTSNWNLQGAKPSGQVGPAKAPTNVRMVTTTDFAPDVCKDYKQTGFCGFGDSCKFLHAREDYKQGWQLDKEWEKAGKADKNKANDSQDNRTDEEKMLEGIPFKCIICKEDYKRPVLTRCGHYFCEKCAMTRYLKEGKKGCANCGADTGGTFNAARKLRGLLERKREREKEKAEEDEEKEKD
jgi:RING finger protein 113A